MELFRKVEKKKIKLKLKSQLTKDDMQAILFYRGSCLSVYYLNQDPGGSEVKDFLDSTDDPKDGAYIRGFIQTITRIGEGDWPRLTAQQRKCWTVDKEQFCELLKGPWRIGCFLFGPERRLLLATVFFKSQRKEKAEYKRAVGLYKAFCRDPIWR
jgi:hypothetical protein